MGGMLVDDDELAILLAQQIEGKQLADQGQAGILLGRDRLDRRSAGHGFILASAGSRFRPLAERAERLPK